MIGTDTLLHQIRQRSGPAKAPQPPKPPQPAALLDTMKIPYSFEAADGAMPVATIHLWGRQVVTALLLMPRGMRADFRRIARRAKVPRLQLAPKTDTLMCFGQTRDTLSPFGLIHDTGKTVNLAVDARVLAAPQLGFPSADARTPVIWLSPDAFGRFLLALGYRLTIGDFVSPEKPRPRALTTSG